jgi:hypothetical protein
LAKFGLELHPDKTRLIEFGRRVAIDRRLRGLGKPETFDFLGFTHICARMPAGRFWVRRITIKKRMRAKLAEGHCCIETKGVFTMHQRSGADPSGTLENRNKPVIWKAWSWLLGK